MDWVSLISVGGMFLVHLLAIITAVLKSKNKVESITDQLTSSHQQLAQEIQQIKALLSASKV